MHHLFLYGYSWEQQHCLDPKSTADFQKRKEHRLPSISNPKVQTSIHPPVHTLRPNNFFLSRTILFGINQPNYQYTHNNTKMDNIHSRHNFTKTITVLKALLTHKARLKHK